MAVNPTKYFSKDLINKPIPLDVWLQGTIEETIGNDILIISDNFGKVKITKCESADGAVDTKSLCKGTYCCIIGVAVNTKEIPEVQATKFIDLSMQPPMKMSWETEVKEAQLLLQGKILPIIK
ncbi:PREDICTED: uncharacterized protein LOC106102231 [Papilio polytes]|uniref:uncharacterized protein LOC106102231 n=1 Tax=Papilio polytes TaxID=76194 RepID=UPI0006762B9F|nr:PREDICTED: uncharacterized protein LOC106102231 [Papilio polytes]